MLASELLEIIMRKLRFGLLCSELRNAGVVQPYHSTPFGSNEK